ncbi:MAG: hypothetical protein DMG41_16935 [Acidobacteria bacterium]|nr:MAG: hypothetical protein AUH13_06705 [Acidobacteria bacterium 13_2_20CM_58_27]PYT67714.1 MAG: hypothetical protein DMG42_26095 [Acidobacteriota bacterium]PYT87039.1 MAG: hypothetical protein DMG41_16935 [Acidobacteriota bacterium]
MSLGPGGSASGAFLQPAASDPRVPVILRMRRGAGWFLTIAILSGINSLLEIFGAKIRFIFGLGITQLVDAIGHGGGQNGMFVPVAVDGIFIVMLILCSKWAKAGSPGAFLGGMIAYALDGVLLLLFSMWLDAAVHAYALYMIWQGYAAARELVQMQQAAQPGLSQPTLP